MLTTERLSIKYLNRLISLNNKRREFNNLNEDFVKYYTISSFIGKFILRKQVYLIKSKENIVGYIWFTRINSDKKVLLINSLYLEKDYLLTESLDLSTILRSGTVVYYDGCLDSDCSKFMENTGFLIKQGTYVLKLKLISRLAEKCNNKASFIRFKRGKHEKLRCELQNSIFSSVERSPLTIQDILVDELQDYYVNDWCIFIKHDNIYAGYGQIILQNNVPLIVNFGIMEEHRNKGLGDLLLTHLLNLLYDSGYNEVKIKVNDDNIPAYELYKKKGFQLFEEYKTWIKHIKT